VAVLPTHRRRGLLRRLMTALLDQAAERGEPYALLNASESGIYGRFGFGVADRVLRFELDTRHADFVAPVAEGRFELVDRREAAPVVGPLYDRFARSRPGALGRSEAWWDQVLHQRPGWRGGGDPFVVVHRGTSGQLDGYAIYRSVEHWEHGHPAGRIEVRELEAAHPDVETALWRFLCDVDLRTTVVAYPRPFDDPLPWRLAEPRRAWVTWASDLLWACPVDVAAVLGGRRYALDDELVLEVTDPLRDRGGTYRVAGGPDGAECARTDAEADLRLGVSTVGSLSLGGIDAGELGSAGRITELTPGALGRADRFFRWRPAPFCATTF
jgi:predicted acetyltransferase